MIIKKIFQRPTRLNDFDQQITSITSLTFLEESSCVNDRNGENQVTDK